ncbi:lysozyme [Planomonospora sp. ID67723]|uniref:lysozyme n=1 Tax=Planomonospora sp. ID67723 TaxID=2738134 RepID=UPI0018C4212B|nr:lysozyme [Planomonospora sp. ID67723]MBG0827027.1 lysozyme [Planomonospora sp. ID67723]
MAAAAIAAALASGTGTAQADVSAGAAVGDVRAAPAAVGALHGPAVPGVDVSNWTGEIDWGSVAGSGTAFAFVYASEGLDYVNERFEAQYGGAAEAGLLRGAYHFAQPHESGGTAQADFFVDNGGAWTPDGKTLPGVLDVEDNPYNNRNGLNSCYGLDKQKMVAWIGDFTRRYRQRTGRDAIIYTTTSWWRTCTGDSPAFGRHPLWLARWGAEPGELPAGWTRHTFWQSADRGRGLPGGQNSFNGTLSQLKLLARPRSAVKATGRVTGNTYTVTVANTTGKPVTALKVSGRTFGGQKIAKVGEGCRFSGTAVRCTIARLAPGAATRLTIVTRPAAPTAETKGMKITVGTVNLTLTARTR